MIGDRSLLPDGVLRSVERVEEATRLFEKHSLNFALAYGGRKEIVDVVRSIATLVEDNVINVDEIDEMSLHIFFTTTMLSLTLTLSSGQVVKNEHPISCLGRRTVTSAVRISVLLIGQSFEELTF
jgi:tritrans,polycis-undecaprenyl-diphosphate synthase [geranylgeranyl-diphosphate specific]